MHSNTIKPSLLQRKWLLVTLGLLMVLFFAIGNAMAYDEPEYQTLDEKALGIEEPLPRKIELRQYESVMVAEVEIETEDWYSAARQGFRPLANFIFGSNDKNEKIGMTIPVTTHSASEKTWTVAFMMPERYNRESLPGPMTQTIEIKDRPASLMATIRFSSGVKGQAGKRNFQKAESRLRATLDKVGLKPAGPAIYAVYNGPFTPFFLRRNEVLIPIEQMPANPESTPIQTP